MTSILFVVISTKFHVVYRARDGNSPSDGNFERSNARFPFEGLLMSFKGFVAENRRDGKAKLASVVQLGSDVSLMAAAMSWAAWVMALVTPVSSTIIVVVVVVVTVSAVVAVTKPLLPLIHHQDSSRLECLEGCFSRVYGYSI